MDAIRYNWIDEFIANIRPYVFVRTDDNILIKKPNVAQKLNDTGARILKELLSGISIEELIKRHELDEQKISETICFMQAVKATLENKMDIGTCNPAVVKRPFTAPFSLLPVLSELAVTSKCNLRCSFCYAGINCNAKKGKDLSENQLKRLLGKIRNEAKVPSVSFTGGEPMLRKGIYNLINFAKESGMRTNLISNGTLIDTEAARRLKRSGLDTAQISIEAPDPETHDHICGVKGSFYRSVNAIKFLKENGIHVHGNTTLSAQNADIAHGLPAFFKKMGMDRFSMNLVIPVGSVTENSSISISYSHASDIIRRVQEESVHNGIEFMWYSPVPLKIFNTITAGLGNKGCAACDGLLSVDSAGNILPCSSWDEPIGNLLDKPFSEIWNGARAAHIRNKREAPPECEGCENFAVCQGACPLFWRVMPKDELIKSCQKNKT